MIEQRVTLRYDAQQIPAIVQAVQGDTGRDVIFELADYEIPAGATANYYIDKPDGNAVYNSAEVISSTEILAHLTEQALAEPGRNNGQVRILADGEVITSFDFVLEVEAFRGILRMQSETEINIFDQAIEDAVNTATEEAVAEIQAQTPVVTGMQNSIAPTYSSSSTYAVGDYVMYNAQLYKCNTAITTAEAWTAAHWTHVPIASDVSDLNSAISKIATITTNLFDKEAGTNNTLMYASGSTVETVNVNGIGYSDYIKVGYNKKYSFLSNNEFGSAKTYAYAFDSSKNYVGLLQGTIDSNGIVTFTNTKANAVYVCIDYMMAEIGNVMFVEGDVYPEEYIPFGSKVAINNDVELNGITVEKLTNGISDVIAFSENVLDLNNVDVVLNKVLVMSGSSYVELAVSGYGYSGFVEINVGDTFCFKKMADLGSGASNVFLFDSSKNFVQVLTGTTNAHDSSVADVTITSSNVKYARFNFVQNANYMVVRGNNYPAEYHAYGEYAYIKNVGMGNVLYGKTIVTAGDSYTEARFTGDYAEYNGKNYGYYIAERNGMTFYNRGISGSTMTVTDSSNPSLRSPFSYQRYINIPETDYLTIWFGINDSAYAQLGTIDDTENTTFYGAWNKVLKYYLENRPYMKVLIIITMSSDNLDFQEAVRNVAKKWGYPYLDFRRDTSVPAFFDKEDMGTEAQTLRRNAFGWNGPVAGHPNPKMHEYESTIIEAFLRGI